MLRHIVAWKLDPAGLGGGADKEDVAGELCAQLVALQEVIPDVIAITAGTNCIPVGGNWDFALVADFPDQRALNAYATDPRHLEIVDQIKAVVSHRVAVDICL